MQNYQKFFNIHTAGEDDLHILKKDFHKLLEDTLLDIDCDQEYIPSIVNSLYSSMINFRVYYHTPVHVMSIFSFAKEHHIELSRSEKLAIFFHDAIYRPGSKNNERYSIDFMKSLLNETRTNNDVINIASHIIHYTALHLEELISSPGVENLVMDLDMSGFSATPGVFTFQSLMIEKEFHRGYGSDLFTLEQFLKGRKKFLTALKNKKTIYRTEFFLDKFEKRAQINLSNAIIEVDRRIESEL
jgi:predicted metal-dependent HD superfamily phosphohydrolase